MRKNCSKACSHNISGEGVYPLQDFGLLDALPDLKGSFFAENEESLLLKVSLETSTSTILDHQADQRPHDWWGAQ